MDTMTDEQKIACAISIMSLYPPKRASVSRHPTTQGVFRVMISSKTQCGDNFKREDFEAMLKLLESDGFKRYKSAEVIGFEKMVANPEEHDFCTLALIKEGQYDPVAEFRDMREFSALTSRMSDADAIRRMQKERGISQTEVLSIREEQPCLDLTEQAPDNKETTTVAAANAPSVSTKPAPQGQNKRNKTMEQTDKKKTMDKIAAELEAEYLGRNTVKKVTPAKSKVMDKVQDMIKRANEEFKKFVSFPFTMEEVVMTAEEDTAGIYVRSGNTPVCAIARVGDPERVVKVIEDEILYTVNCTRTAVERRGKLKAEHEALVKADKELKAAKAALEAQNLPVGLLGQGDEEVAKAIVSAAQKAVKEANRGLNLVFGHAVEAMGGLKAVRLCVHGYAGGLVVTANGKACMVTRFPKSRSNKTIEKTVEFIGAEVSALGDSRRRYMAEMEKALLHEEQLHAIAKKLDEANNMLVACK